MDEKLLKLIIAQQVVIMKRLEEIEYRLKGGGSNNLLPETRVENLRLEAKQYIDYIKLK